MGALDDAIKEHLELKRKHGAAEDEVRELEKEALGPPQSTLPPVEPAARPLAPDPATAEEPVADLPPLPPPPPPFEDTMERPAPPADPPPAPPESSQETVDFTPDFALEDDPMRDRDDEPPPPVPSMDRDEGAEDEHDVLEDTPEFLDDAPEHDSLWFEQRPPRDFDFDD